MFAEILHHHTRLSCIYHNISCIYYKHFKIQQASKMSFSSDSENSFDDNSNETKLVGNTSELKNTREQSE